MTTTIQRGRVWKYGDDVNTDVIFPGKYTYTVTDPAEIAAHALEDLDPTFATSVQSGDIIVAGRNWGAGSSREQAVTCLRHAGVTAIIAKSFARIYYRNAMNNGIHAITCPALVDAVAAGDEIAIDEAASTILHAGVRFPFPAPAPETRALLDAGGLIAFTRRRLATERTAACEGASERASERERIDR